MRRLCCTACGTRPLRAVSSPLGYIVCAVYGERGRLPRRYGVGFPLEIAAFSFAAAYIADASARQFVFALLGSLAFTVLWVLLVNEGGRK